MIKSNFKKTLAAAAVITAIAAAPSQSFAEISMNTDTGVSVETIINSGLKPETRIIYPEQQPQATQVISSQSPVQYRYTTQPSLPSTEQSTQAAAQITAETDTSLINVDGDAPMPTDGTSQILPQGNTLSKLGTRMDIQNEAQIAPSTTISNLNRSADQNRILNSLGPDESMSDTLGATNTTVSSSLSTTNSLDNRSSLRSGSTVYSGVNTSGDTQPYSAPTSSLPSRSDISGSVNSSRSGSMAGSSAGSSSMSGSMGGSSR